MTNHVNSGYTGHVTPEGPAQTRDLAGLRITKFSVSAMDNNCYLLEDRGTGKKILIDAAANAERILEVTGTDLEAVITTHRHWDHVRALQQVIEATGAESYAHPDDAPEVPVVTKSVTDGQRITLGSCDLQIIHLVGHTPGSIAVKYDDPEGFSHIWSGDSLFPGGVGKTDGPENFTSLVDDVEEKIFNLSTDGTTVYPGHGDDTTIGKERPHLYEWRKRGW
ncbi:MBL fold metallo-hydrolase [Salininema proteolyticum]|uniref:MBL fold metallo-hydrolase n=1 Tax=Salininema proteolyticum TaxID=1607685 RepID=A0ABV8U4S9_9ACTN